MEFCIRGKIFIFSWHTFIFGQRQCMKRITWQFFFENGRVHLKDAINDGPWQGWHTIGQYGSIALHCIALHSTYLYKLQLRLQIILSWNASPELKHLASARSTRLIYHQLGFHLAHRRVEVVLDDLPNVSRNLRLELFHKFDAVVIHIPGNDWEEMPEHKLNLTRNTMGKMWQSKKREIMGMRRKKII